MPLEFDILIAGAGPAGCAAAYDLARAGKRVLLLDKRSFPRHKACACGLTRKTLKALRYSVDPIVERVCHEIVLQQAGDDSRQREVRVKTRSPICAMAVRERFDKFCLDQTLTAGRDGGSATLLKIESIAALREAGSRGSALPTHIELDLITADGPLTLRAPVLIGADGSNGQTRRLEAALTPPTNLSSRPESVRTGAPNGRSLPEWGGFADGAERPASPATDWYTHGFALEATVPYTALPARLPSGDAPHDLIFDFAPLPGGYGWLFPKGDHINIGVGVFALAEDVETSHDAQLKQVTRTLLNQYSEQKLGIAQLEHITGQHLGMGGHAYVPRGRVLLVGDAAGLVDPLTGEGIHSAIVSGQAAAAAILENTPNVAAAYARHLRTLQRTLTFSLRASRAFYKEPARGFKAMRIPFMRSLILKTYADGLPYTRLLTALAKLV